MALARSSASAISDSVGPSARLSSPICRAAPVAWQAHHVRLTALDEPTDVQGPSLQRGALLRRIRCTVVGASNARPSAADVVQNGLHNVRGYAQLSHAGDRK